MTRRSQHLLTLLLGVSLLLGTTPGVLAVSPPNVLSYQGRLLNTAGVPVADTDAEMSFELYDAEAGNCVWSNDSADCNGGTGAVVTQTVTLSDGLFSENLGDVAVGYAAMGDEVFSDNTELWLQVTINGEPLLPRKQLTASPFAMNADALDGFNTSQAGGSNAFVPVTDSSGNLTLTEDLALNGGELTSTGDLTITAAGGELFIGSDVEPSGSHNLGDAGNGWNSIYLDVGGVDIGLEDATSATSSGAFAIGAFDEFSVACSNVQDCLDELDAAIATVDSSVDLDNVYDNDVDKTLVVDSTNGLLFNLTTTGDLLIQDNGVTFATFNDSGHVAFENDVTLGSSNADILTINGELASALIPNVDGAYALGGPSDRWSELYLTSTSIHIGDTNTDEGIIFYNSADDIFTFKTDTTTNADIAFFDDNLYLDKSSGNVGLGDVTPAATLTVGDGDLFQVAGATGSITTSGDLALNGDDLTSDGTLTIDSSGTVQLGTDDDLLPQPGAGSADLGASGTRWDNIFSVAGDFSGTVTAADFSCTDCLDFTELSDSLALDTSTSIAIDGSEAFTVSNTGTSNVIFDLASTGDTAFKDNGITFLSLNDDASIDYTSTSTSDGIDILGSSLTSGDVVAITHAPTTTYASRVLSVQQNAGLNTAGIISTTTDTLTFDRTLTLDGGGSWFESGHVLSVTNNATETSGTIADTSNVLHIEQNFADATGAVLGLTSAATGGVALSIDSAATTAHLVDVTANSLTTGSAVYITTGDTTNDAGRALTIVSGETSATADIVSITSDGGGGFRVEGDGEAFSDTGFTANETTSYLSESIVSSAGILTIDAAGLVEITDSLSITGDTISATPVTSFACTDCIDFDDLSDALTLDTATTIGLTANNLTISGSGTGDVVINPDSDTNLQITATAAPGVDMLTLTNSGQASTTNGVDGVSFTFAATNASGDLLHLSPSYTGGGNNGLTYSILEVDAFAPTNSAGTDTINGIVFGAFTDPGATITSTGLSLAGGWDTGISIGDQTTELSLTSTTPTVAIGGGGTLNITDGSNTLFSVIDIGTTGSITVTGGTINTSNNNSLALTPNGTGDVTVGIDADTNMQLTASAAPGADLLSVMANGGNASTTNNVDGVQVNFGTSNASGSALHLIPSYAGGATDTLTYNILEMDAVTPSNSAGTDTFNGILLGQMTDPGATITSTGIKIGNGWDDAININSGQLIAETTGVLSVGLDNTATTNGLCHSGTNVDAATDTTRDIVPCSSAPADYAEWYETDGTPQPGDVVALTDTTFTFTATETNASTGLLDGTTTKTLPVLTKASASDQKTIFGIVSTSPIETIGSDVKRQGSHPQPIALNGRVPLHATDENGSIEPGDPLTASSTAGYAMKASEGDVIIAVALDWLSSGNDTIEAFVRYAAGTIVEDSVTETTASEVSTESLSTLSMGGSIYMNGNHILSIGRLEGIDDNWSIAEDGTFTTTMVYQTEIAGTTGSTVDVYATMSPQVTITLSGTGTLSSGRAMIKFEDIDPGFNDIISTVAPIRVLVTPNGPTGVLYVSEKDNNGFTVEESGGSSDGVSFDWFVVAYRNGYEPDEELDTTTTEETTPPTETPTTDTPAESTETSADESTTPDATTDATTNADTTTTEETSTASDEPSSDSTTSTDPSADAPVEAPPDTGSSTESTDAPSSTTDTEPTSAE